MGYESIAHEAEGRMGYSLRGHEDDLQIGPRTHTICFDACPPVREIT